MASLLSATWRTLRGLVALVLPLSLAEGQAASPAADSLLPRALSALSTGDTVRALGLLHELTDREPRNPDALLWRGALLARSVDMGATDVPAQVLAWRLLSRGSEIAPRDPRFVLELARLRRRTLLLRVDAERLLARALSMARTAQDRPLIAESAAEYAAVYVGRYQSAWKRRVYTGGLVFDPALARTRLNYTREFIEHQSRAIENAGAADRDGADRLFREALAADPSHLPSGVGLVRLLYDQERFAEMRGVAAGVLNATPTARQSRVIAPPPFAVLQRLRATLLFADGLAAWRLGRGAEADARFTSALTVLSDAERAEVEDIGRILREGDSVRVAGLPDSLRTATVRAFWDAADPLLSTAENEARLEYFARVAVSMLRYDDPERALRGWRTDRGTVVIRYGEPPVEALFPPTSDLLARDATGRVITVFRYPALEREFVFAGAPTFTDATFIGDFRSMAEAARVDEPFRLDNVPLARTVDSIPVQVTRFRGRTAAEHHVLTAAALPTARLYRDVELDRGELTVRTFRGPLGRMETVSTQVVPVTLPARTEPMLSRVDTLPGGDFRLRLESVDAGVAAAAARAHVTVTLDTPRPGTLALSDLLVGRRTGTLNTAPRAAGEAGVREAGVRPLARLRLAPRDTFALYWEAYDVRADAAGAMKLEVNVSVELLEILREGNAVGRMLGSLADVVGLTAEGDTRLSVRFPLGAPLGGRDRVASALSLSLGTAPAGRYRLVVEVHDTISGQRATSTRELVISPAP